MQLKLTVVGTPGGYQVKRWTWFSWTWPGKNNNDKNKTENLKGHFFARNHEFNPKEDRTKNIFKTVGNSFCRCYLYWVYLTFSLGKEVNIVVPQGIFLLLLLLLRFVLTNSISHMWKVSPKGLQNSDKVFLSFGKWIKESPVVSSCVQHFLLRPVTHRPFYFTWHVMKKKFP